MSRLEIAKKRYGGSHDLPSLDGLREMIAATLWAGFRREEGRTLSFALAYVRQDAREIVFRRKLKLNEIVRLAPALVRKRSRLGVDKALRVWGITQTTEPCLKVRALAPGRVVVKYGPENIAVLDAPQLHLAGNLEQCLTVLAESLPLRKARPLGRTVFAAVALMLVDAVRRHGNGGTILIVPTSSPNTWRRHVQAGKLGLADQRRRYSGLKVHFEKLLKEAEQARGSASSDFKAVLEVEAIKAFLGGERIKEELWRVVSTVAELSAIDGALVLDYDLALVDFGVRITSEGDKPYLERDILAAPIPRSHFELGGTRHRSAANFVRACRGSALALVASHDGPLSVMEWKNSTVLVTRHVERLID